MTIRNRPPPRPSKERDAVIRAWLLAQVRKGNLPRSTVGAAGIPVWIKAVTVREGDDVVTKCCIVAGGDVLPITVRVNVPALVRGLSKLRAMGKLPASADAVGGFGSFLKGVVKGVTHNAVTKAVGKVVSKVARSPIVQIANPMMAITSHTLSKAAGGRGTVKGKLGGVIDVGASIVAPAALKHVGPQALGALGLGAKAVMQSQIARTAASVAKQAQQVVARGKQAAALVQSGRLQARTALPLIKAATTVRAGIVKNAPRLAANVSAGKRVQAALANVAIRARAGSPEAKRLAAAVTSAAKMTDKISAAQQAAGGGNAGFVVTAQGKIRRSPKGKFIRTAALPAIETLYRGAKEAPLRGSFTAVSGSRKHDDRPTLIPSEYRALEAEVYRALVDDAYQRDTERPPATDYRLPSRRQPAAGSRISGSPGSVEHTPQWGGARDPGDEYDGPLYSVRYAESPLVERVQGNVRNLQGFVAGHSPGSRQPAAGFAWRAPEGTTARERERIKALLELARARHHLEQVRKRGTKVGNMSSLMVGSHFDLGQEDVGTPPELTEMSDGLPNVDLLVTGDPWGVGANLLVSGDPWGVGSSLMVGCGPVGCQQSVAGVPWYNFTRAGVTRAQARARFVRALKKMPPKMRRRVMTRLRAAVLRNKIAGAVRGIQPTVGHYPQGWAGISGVPGGYELVGSHGGAATFLTP